MRIIFFGTPDFAVPTLAKLLSEPEFEVLGVVTQPDTRRGRGNQMSPSPVKELSLQHDLTVWTPDRIKKDTATLEALKALNADVFVVVAYGQILSQAILDMPKQGCINVHGSLLPKYRGAAPIQWAIANGETVVGITTMQMDAGIDTGAMLLKASIDVAPTDQAESLSAKLAELGANLLIETLRQLDRITPEPQNNSESTYAPMIAKEDWLLDWQKSAIALHNQVRGFYPNCYTNHRGQRLKVTTTEVIPQENSAAPLGTLVELRKNLGFAIQTREGLLLIKEVQPAGKRSQTGWDFANGSRLQIGEAFI
ncbi:methionyl-tRNA formyltransferase [Tumidithrix elongata RA019]|uniref:Methionyl-tRNA formyltransferase n=1 Tax=Tumidithrix elongata BACA0141 TaxID=2716417 RepID=A0AAW9QBM2_9CYAN|nr:methionyl-tRNA formyltransferase [Tumidithrix elongata RA019]